MTGAFIAAIEGKSMRKSEVGGARGSKKAIFVVFLFLQHFVPEAEKEGFYLVAVASHVLHPPLSPISFFFSSLSSIFFYQCCFVSCLCIPFEFCRFVDFFSLFFFNLSRIDRWEWVN